MIELQQLRKEAATCEDCLGWHHHCNAECCRQFAITTKNKMRLKIGNKYAIALPNISTDQKWYYELHGCKIDGTIIMFKLGLHKWVRSGKEWKLILYKRCDLLDGMLCSGHPSDKPQVCKDLTLKTVRSDKYYLTPNCLFNHKGGQQ